MVERALRFLTREHSGLHEAAFLLGFFALLSQITGLIRDRLLASVFGAGTSLDLYYAAFRIPDLLYVSVASLVASTALIPLIYAKERGEGDEDAKTYLSRVLTTFSLSMIIVGGVVWCLLPYITPVLVPGFAQDAQQTYTTLARILLLSPFFLGLSNLFGSITQASRRFFSYAFAPILYNGGILVGIFLFVPTFGLQGLVYGVILGALLHMGTQVFTLFGHGLLPTFSALLSWNEIRELIGVSLPRTIGLAVHQIAMIVLIGLASRIESGSIAIFTLATNLQNIPLMIVGSSYAVAAFPTLARLYGSGSKDEFLAQLIQAVKHIIFWSAPAIVLFIVVRAQIVRTVLGSGAFDWTATRLTAAALALLMFSLIAHSLVLLFARGYYAMGNTRTPLLFNTSGALSMVGIAFLSLFIYTHSPAFQYFFETLFRVEGVPGTSMLMLPMSYALGMVCSMTLYFLHLRRMFPQAVGQTRTLLLHSSGSSVLAGYIAYITLQTVSRFLDTETLFGVGLQGALALGAGLFTWITVLLFLGNRELKEIAQTFRARFWKTTRPIAGEQEEL